jgi:hypothetical protein
MTEYTETDFNVDKKDVVQMCDRIAKFLMKDFDKKFNQHKSLDHKWFIQGTIHGVCRGLFVDKQVAVYLILGSNPRRPGWGELKKKYDIDPVKFVLRREVVAEGKKLMENHGFKVFFTDTNRNGDFHMKVVFYPYNSEGDNKDTKTDAEGFTTVKTKSKAEFKSYAGAAYRGKDKPDPKPMADPSVKAKPVLPKNTLTLLAGSESDSDESKDSSSSK